MTVQNYEENNELFQRYHSQGLEILGFPCAQFWNQEPGTNDEILNCLKYVRPGGGYSPLFTIFEKTTVNGIGMNKVYDFLRARCGPPKMDMIAHKFVSWTPVAANDITWNFEKFLLDRKGNVYRRYTPQTNPLLLENDIMYLLNGGLAPQ